MAFIDGSRDEETTVSFAQTLARSPRFKALFAEGMALVEEAAGYLDGPGRTDAGSLRTGLKGAYAAESMRLTTRLMQIASWLLVRRAIVEGEGLAGAAERSRVRIDLTAQQLVTAPAVFAQLPEALQALTHRSLQLQTRVLHLDRMIHAADGATTTATASGLDQQIARLRAAFASAP